MRTDLSCHRNRWTRRAFCRWTGVSLGGLFGADGGLATRAVLSQEVDADGSSPLDTVWLEPRARTSAESDWYPRAIEQRRVRVIEYGPELIRFVAAGERQETTIAATRVLWVTPGHRSEFETRGLELFAAKQHAAALPVLIDAIGTRPPVWHQQWLSMVAAQAAWRGGRAEIALELINQVERRPVTPLVLAWLPVAWDSSRQPGEAFAAAQARIIQPSPAMQLVAASWLLSTKRGQATQILRFLTQDQTQPSVAKLAEIVLWRTSPPREVKELGDSWRAEIKALPLVLQLGPLIMLWHKLQAAAEHGEAARLQLALQLSRPYPHPDLPESRSAAVR